MYGAAHTKLNVRGYFKAYVEHGYRMSEQEVFVVNGARCALLGRPAIESLKLVEDVNSVETGGWGLYGKIPSTVYLAWQA